MISDTEIVTAIRQLPEELQQEALHYIAFLATRRNIQSANVNPKKRQFGSAKGKYILAPDFDAPLQDFKDYM
jgi:hypothetical protein